MLNKTMNNHYYLLIKNVIEYLEIYSDFMRKSFDITISEKKIYGHLLLLII